MDTLWLGYDGLSIPCVEVAAVLTYHPALDDRIARHYGRVPRGVRAVVITSDGSCLPSSRDLGQLRSLLAAWRRGDTS